MDETQPYRHILVERRNGVCHLVLNRPERLNALGFGSGSSRDEIVRAVSEADADDAVGCVLISANGRAFCAGGDLNRIAGRGEGHETPLEAYRFNDANRRFTEALRSSLKPIIAAVHGLCLGAGLGFIAQADIVIASDDAQFGLIEGRIGHPGAAELVPLIGAAWTKFLILTGELISATRAAQIGLVPDRGATHATAAARAGAGGTHCAHAARGGAAQQGLHQQHRGGNGPRGRPLRRPRARIDHPLDDLRGAGAGWAVLRDNPARGGNCRAETGTRHAIQRAVAERQCRRKLTTKMGEETRCND